jgi:stearoyl-CoA desaturase (delta-9 desaturase)
VAIGAIGEGWHNYHHTFPWDYKTAELGQYSTNFTSMFIDSMAKIGQAYDLKTASDDMIRKRVLRTGDGSHPAIKCEETDKSK